MRFVRTNQDGAIVLRIEGELDATTVTDIRPVLEQLAQDKPARVVVDLSALRLIDSSGVGAIIALFKRLRESGGQLTVDGLAGQPQAIFQVLRLDRVLTIR